MKLTKTLIPLIFFTFLINLTISTEVHSLFSDETWARLSKRSNLKKNSRRRQAAANSTTPSNATSENATNGQLCPSHGRQ